MPRRLVPAVLGLALLGLAAPGCGPGDDLPRHPISGTVSMDGAPMKSGMIQFQPAMPGVTVAGGSGIVDGAYAIPKAEGLVPGKYLVLITGSNAQSEPARHAMPGDPPPPFKETVPEKYNVKSELTAEVSADGPNTFNFQLKSK